MQIVLERKSAEILPFTARSVPSRIAQKNRLTMQDRMQALEWEAAHANPAGARLETHSRRPDDAPELGDYIGIYRAHEPWLIWGVARHSTGITVWHGPSGTDFGTFETMKGALAAIGAESIQPRTGAGR